MNTKIRNGLVALGAVLALAIGVTVYLEVFLPQCSLSKSESVSSGDKKHFAFIEWRQCESEDRSLGQVLVGSVDTDERIVAVEFRPPEHEVKLRWDPEGLKITIKKETAAKQFGPYVEWPQIQVMTE